MNIFDILQQRFGKEQILLNEPMANHTTFKVGGPADVFVIPKTIDDMVFILAACRDNGVPYFVIGNGSNLLVRDGGIRGVVISMSELCDFSLLDGDKIYAQAGCMMPEISKFALEHSLAGLEFAEGIPGSIGGGVVMNAGAYGGEMKDVFYAAQVIDKKCDLIDMDLCTMDFSYRSSYAQEHGLIICGIVMQLTQGNRAEIAEKMSGYRARRQEKQPLRMPSAGSTFKRPPGYFAGKLIMDAGLRGFSIGGAQVSEKHCGFVVNKGGATASDILTLIEHVQAIVLEKFDVTLETEVKIVGEV